MKTLNKTSMGKQYAKYDALFGGSTVVSNYPHVLTDIVTVPADGINPGNHLDATDWQYTVDVSQQLVGVRNDWFDAAHTIPYYTTTGLLGGGPNVLAAWNSSVLYNRALNRLNDKVRNTADWSETIAEASQLKRMANLAASAVDLAKSGKSKVAKAAGAYLSLKLGWQPLMQTIFDTADAIIGSNLRQGLICVRGGATERVNTASRVAAPVGYSTKVWNQTIEGKQGVRFEIWMQGKVGNSLSDFTTLNPVLLGWNLVPYSFVVDWFYDIGGYLENIELALLYDAQMVSGSVTYLDGRYLKEVAIPHWIPGLDAFVSQGEMRRKYVYFKRQRLTSWPLPRKPHFKVDLGSGQLLTAAALLGAILGRK